MSSRRLRIVHVVRSDSFAGVERSIALSARALVDRGHEVRVIGGHPELMRFHLDGSGVSAVPATSTLDTVRALGRVRGVDVVHAHMTAAEAAALSTRFLHRAALVSTRHFAQRRGTSKAGRLVAGAIGRAPFEQIAISQFVADRVEGRSTIVGHGLPTAERVEASSTTVLVAQRLEREKDTETAIRAFASSGLHAAGWKLVVAGDGAERPLLETLCRSLGLPDAVEFRGRVEDVDALRRQAALQMASPPGEHFGLSVLEAMACGLPVVAADGGAHRELLGQAYPALFPPGDAEAAAALLRDLAGSMEQRADLGLQLQHRQRDEFSLERHAAALEEVYLRALQPRRRTSTAVTA